MRDSYTNKNHCPSHEMWSYERDGRWRGWSFVRGSTVEYLKITKMQKNIVQTPKHTLVVNTRTTCVWDRIIGRLLDDSVVIGGEW